MVLTKYGDDGERGDDERSVRVSAVLVDLASVLSRYEQYRVDTQAKALSRCD